MNSKIQEKASITLKGKTYESEEHRFILHWEGQEYFGKLILENEWDADGSLINNSQVIEFENDSTLPQEDEEEREELEDFILNSIKDDWGKRDVK